jgi:hypothetical protein
MVIVISYDTYIDAFSLTPWPAMQKHKRLRICTQRTQKQSYRLMIYLCKAIRNRRTRFNTTYGNKNKIGVSQIQRAGNEK